MRATTSCALVTTSVLLPDVAVTDRDSPGSGDMERVAPDAGAVENEMLTGRPAAGFVVSEQAASTAVAAANVDAARGAIRIAVTP
jgi:hypothetical protein